MTENRRCIHFKAEWCAACDGPEMKTPKPPSVLKVWTCPKCENGVTYIPDTKPRCLICAASKKARREAIAECLKLVLSQEPGRATKYIGSWECGFSDGVDQCEFAIRGLK